MVSDDASLMNGVNKSVQQLVSQSDPLAIYRYEHKLNLLIADACKSVLQAREFLHYFKDCMLLLQVLLCVTNGLNLRTSYILGNQGVNSSDSETFFIMEI